MKRFAQSKYYLGIWFILLLTYNIVLYLVIKDTVDFSNDPKFYIIYTFIMIGFLALGLMGLLNGKKNPLTELYIPFIIPFSTFIIILGTVLLAVRTKLSYPVLISPLVIICGFFAISLLTAGFYRSRVTQFKEKTIEIHDIYGLVEYLTEMSKLSTDRNVLAVINKLIASAKTQTIINDSIADLEKQIYEYVGFMRRDLERNEINNFYANAEKAAKLLNQRFERIND